MGFLPENTNADNTQVIIGGLAMVAVLLAIYFWNSKKKKKDTGSDS